MVEMSKKLRSNHPSVLILADFLDGSWHATSFAMQFLHNNKSNVSMLQTYQDPKWGHFMMRKITPQLKEITKYELKQLKTRLISNYNIDEKQINTLSIEGELNSILQHNTGVRGTYNTVLGTYSSFSDSCNMQNKCIEEIINTSKNPLFIVPGEFNGLANKKLLFVGNPTKTPSKQLIDHILKICNKTQSDIEILFVLKKGIPKISDDVMAFYNKSFERLDFEINQIANSATCKGIKKHLRDREMDLIIIENSK